MLAVLDHKDKEIDINLSKESQHMEKKGSE